MTSYTNKQGKVSYGAWRRSFKSQTTKQILGKQMWGLIIHFIFASCNYQQCNNDVPMLLGRFDLKSESSIEQKYFVMTPRSYQTGITLANQVHKKLK